MSGAAHTRQRPRAQDALHHLGHEIGRTTVKRILLDHGIEPAPERERKTSWRAFIGAHLGEIAAADFFSVEVFSGYGLVRSLVFFVIDIKTRRVEIAGITSSAHEDWMMQVARNLTDAVDGFLRDTRYLILDRDPLYTKAFRAMLSESGVKVVRLPARSPNLSPHAERFVLSTRRDCLSRIVPLSEAHLRRAPRAFSAHCHRERHHQGLGGELIVADRDAGKRDGVVACRERLGGLLRFYYREAA